MYKKITHSIFEEQFDHPATLEMVDAKKDIKSTITDLVLANLFRRKIRSSFLHLNNRVRDYMLAVTNNSADKSSMQTRVNAEIQSLGDYLGQFLTPEETVVATQALSTTINAALDTMQSIKNGEDITAQQEQTVNNVMAMTTIPIFRGIPYSLTRVITLWYTATAARVAEKWSEDIVAITDAEIEFVSGSEYSIPVADTISNDILTRFSNKF